MKSRAIIEAEINSEYSRRFEKFGPTAKGVFWASTTRQEKRFEIILKEITKNIHKTILSWKLLILVVDTVPSLII